MSFFRTIQIEENYDVLLNEKKEISGVAQIISSKEEKISKNKYIVKYNNFKLLLYLDKNIDAEFGDIIYFEGKIENGNSTKNFNIFNYNRYLRQNKIGGVLKITFVKKLYKEKSVLFFLENIKNKLKKNVFNIFDKEKAGFLSGLLLGDKQEVSDEIVNDFRDSSLSHILALSGLHVTYVILGIKFLLDLVTKNQRLKNFLIIFFLIFFSIFTGGSPSCIRACIMSSMIFLSKVVYRKNDFFTSFLISLNIILIINCYNIENIGMWLSFLATFGLFCMSFSKNKFFENKNLLLKITEKFLDTFKTSISCNLMIIPIIWNSYNIFSITFLISNFLASFLIGPIIILGYIHLFLGSISSSFCFLESFLIKVLFEIAKNVGKIRLSKVVVPSLPIFFWLFYYLIIIVFIYYKKFYLKTKCKIKHIIVCFFIIRNYCCNISEKT